MLQEGAEQQSEAAEAEQQAQALAAARATLSSSLDAPAAAHPFESYGDDGLSLAQARRKLSGCGLQQPGDPLIRKCLTNPKSYTCPSSCRTPIRSYQQMRPKPRLQIVACIGLFSNAKHKALAEPCPCMVSLSLTHGHLQSLKDIAGL